MNAAVAGKEVSRPLSAAMLPEVVAAAQLPPAGPELLVALDIDGTVLNYDGELSPRVKAALDAHIAAGTHIVLCTGRAVRSTQAGLQKVGFTSGFAVCSNGAVVISLGSEPPLDAYGEPVPTTEFGPGVADDSFPVRVFRAHTFDPSYEINLISRAVPEAIFAVETTEELRRLSRPFPPGEMTQKTQLLPVAELAHPRTTRLTIRTPEISKEDLLARLAEIGVHAVAYPQMWSAWLDISPTGVSKETGVADVRQHLGIDPRHVVAIGDSDNDQEMLAAAGLGIAMGNSPDRVRQYADVLTSPVDDDGCARALEELL
ncbi:MAG: HAD-IIB family hydrolase [Trueperella sp.]|nr:HAD-IIB family hydrolase [Trueperella sp.]